MSRAEKREATTAALLEAAAETFAERGFEAATMDEVAERVSLSKGALYHRFATKEDLFLALLDQHCQIYIDQLEKTFGRGDPLGSSRQAAEGFLEVIRDDRWPRLFVEFVSYAARSPRAKRELAKRMRSLRGALAKVVAAEADDAGVELGLPPERVALVILALADGFALERMAQPRGVPDDLYTDALQLLLAGLVAQAPSLTRG
jgi:AcrR family transcriptional regulator